MKLEVIKRHEGLRLNAYLDQVGVPTIGYGTIMYEDGTRVKIGDSITLERAESLLSKDANRRWDAVKHAVKVPVNENQKTAIVSLAYNIGVGGFLSSTVLKRINRGETEHKIREAWMMWNKGRIDGKLVEIRGLTIRRGEEADLYFS